MNSFIFFFSNFNLAHVNECATSCTSDPTCLSFSIFPFATNTSASCCLYTAFSESTYSAVGSLFYSMPQCDACVAGYFKRDRQCEVLSVPPTVQGGTDTVRSVKLPLTTDIGTALLQISATSQVGFGPLTFALAAGSSPVLSINATTGILRLVQPLSQSPSQLSTTIVIRDTRADCTQLDAHGVPRTVDGPCESRVDVVVYPAVFLNCPAPVSAYLALNANNTDVAWIEPTLPPYLGNLTVTRNLGDITAGDDETPPFQYPAGRRTVTYTTEALSIGGRVTCSFDVVVERGFAVDVTSVAHKAEPYMVQEFLVAELGESNDGSRLPALTGTVVDDATLAIGIRAPVGQPFAVTPKVNFNIFFPLALLTHFLRLFLCRLATKHTLRFCSVGAQLMQPCQQPQSCCRSTFPLSLSAPANCWVWSLS